MGVNSDNTSWGADEQVKNTGANKTAGDSNDLLEMMELMTQTSSSFAGRNIREINLASESLKKLFEGRKADRLNTAKAGIVPNLDIIDANISPVLPGLLLWTKIGRTIYFAPFLFHSKDQIVDFEEVQMYAANQQRVSVPRTPSAYIGRNLTVALENSLRQNQGHDLNIVQIGHGIVPLESYFDVRNDEKQLVERITQYIDREWETSVMAQMTTEAGSKGKKLPNVFHGKSPYGPNQTADARILPVTAKLGDNGVLLPSNMEVQVVTTNGQNQNNNNPENAPREVCRVYANVSLIPYGYQDHINVLRRTNGRPMFNEGMTPDGWKPYRPSISLDCAVAGPQMNSNGGIVPWLMGLFVLMCSNNRYAFGDVLRRPKCGVRGSLASLEPRLDKYVRDNNVQRIVGTNSVKLDSKASLDIDAVNQWIRFHIMQSAIFTVPVLPGNINSALTKLIVDLGTPDRKAAAIKTILTAADAITNNAFTAHVSSSDSVWKATDPVYHTIPQLIIDGTACFNGEYFNLRELDEMAVSHMAGPNGILHAENFMRTIYHQDTRENERSRQQRLRVMLVENLNLTDVNITGFGRVGVMDPRFMATIGKVFSGIGTLNTSSLIGSFMNNQAIFAPGATLAVDFAAGSDVNGQGGGNYDFFNI